MDTRATLELAHAAITRRDGKACRAVLAQLPATVADPADNERAIQSRAFCEMTAGNCDGGLRMFVDRFPGPAAGAQVVADMYCSPGSDPVIRLRRLVVQTTRRRVDQLACAHYVPFARAARQAATSDDDKRTVAGVLGTLARCFSTHGQCDDARGLAAEANTLDPRVDARAELAAACRP